MARELPIADTLVYGEEPVRIRRVGYADPGLVGLLGFIFGTLASQLEHLGIQGLGPVFWIGALFGGVLQIIAGMQSYQQGDNFHFLVYMAFGFYWIVMPGFMFANEVNIFEVTGAEKSIFMLGFALLAGAFVPAGATHNTVLPITLAFVCLGLSLESIGFAWDVVPLVRGGAWSLVIASLMACYMLAQKFYALTLGRDLLPLGKPWIEVPGSAIHDA